MKSEDPGCRVSHLLALNLGGSFFREALEEESRRHADELELVRAQASHVCEAPRRGRAVAASARSAMAAAAMPCRL